MKNIKLGIFGLLLLVAWFAFEVVNFATTEIALLEVWGNAAVFGMQVATCMAVGASLLDLAGIARIFTPERGKDEPKEVWFLFGAWLFATIINAFFTYRAAWMYASPEARALYIPVVIAAFVWFIRVLLIGFVNTAGEHLLWVEKPRRVRVRKPTSKPALKPLTRPRNTKPMIPEGMQDLLKPDGLI